MATYFEVVNDKNKVIIDDSIKRFCVSRTGLISTCALVRGINGLGYLNDRLVPINDAPKNKCAYSMGVYELILNEDESFASLYLPSDFGSDNIIYACHPSVNTIRFVVMSNMVASVSYETLAQKARFYTYAPSKHNNDTYGLQVFNASESQIFSSSNRYMNVNGSFSYKESNNAKKIENCTEKLVTDFYNNKHAIVINSNNIFQSGGLHGAYALLAIYGLSVDGNGRYLCRLSSYDFVYIIGYGGGEAAYRDYIPQGYSSHTQFTAIDTTNH